MIHLHYQSSILLLFSGLVTFAPLIIGIPEGLYISIIPLGMLVSFTLVWGSVDICLLITNAMTLGMLNFTEKDYWDFVYTLLGLAAGFITTLNFILLCLQLTNNAIFITLIWMFCYPMAGISCSYGALLTTSYMCLGTDKESEA